jgi:rhodanese-related sulfurtransferase
MRSEDKDGGVLEHWTPQEVFDALQRQEIVLIDVRTPQEYMFEHVEGALLMPMAFFSPEHLPQGDSKTVVLHCGSGARSARTGGACLAAGRGTVAHMEGGFAAWKQAGLPYIGTEMSSGAPRRMGG